MPYDKDPDNNEKYPIDNGIQVIVENKYATDKDGVKFYPKDDQDHEYMVESLGLIKKGDKYVYPQYKTGKPRYRKIDGGDVYEMIGNEWIYGEGLDGKEYYAKDENGNEYYPDDNIPAKMADGNFYYASAADGTHVFPKDGFENEYYLSEIDLTKNTTIPNRYAVSKSGDQIYPLTKTKDNIVKQYIIGNEYAVDKNKKAFYPKDGYFNEYYKDPVNKLEDVVLENYAVTNDGKVILPTNSQGVSQTLKNVLPAVKPDNIIGRIIREKDEPSDVLTDVIFSKPNVDPKSYRYLDTITNKIQVVVPNVFTTPFYKRWWFWIIMVFVALVKSLAVWYFVFRNPPNPSFIRIR